MDGGWTWWGKVSTIRVWRHYSRDGFRHGRGSEGPRRGVSESPKGAPISRKALLGLEVAERPVGKSQQPEVSQQTLMGCL